jgi:hypothetical protein
MSEQHACATEQSPSRPRPFWAPAEPVSTSYRIDVRIDPRENAVTGTERVYVVHRGPGPLAALVLSTGTADGDTVRVRCDDDELPLTPGSIPAGASTLFRIDLHRPLDPGATLELRVDFEGRLPAPQFGVWMLRDWHPRLWWDYPTCDSFEVAIDVPSPYPVAASGRPDRDLRLWRARGAHTFGLVLGDEHQSSEVETGGVRVCSLFTPAGARCARLLLETAVDVIDFYRAELGFYPQPFLTIVPGVDQPVGGFPFATGIVSIHGQERLDARPRDHWRWITAHEIAHQYFGEHVLEADTPGWLWIALGLSLDRQYARARGLEIHRALLERYLQGVRDGVDTTVARPAEQLAGISFDRNNIVVHGKGLAIVSALESVIGQEAFRRARARCLTEFSGKRLGAHQFQAICEEETDQDLEWFFGQWVRSNRYLAYRIAAVEQTEEARGYSAKARVERVGTLEMPIPVEARFEDGSIQRGATDRILQISELTFCGATRVMEVVLDPDGALALLETPVTSAVASEEEVYRAIDRMPWTGSGEMARDLLARAQECAGRSASLWAKLGLALYDGAYYLEAMEAFRQAAERSTDTLTRMVGWVWQGHLLDLLGRREEALVWYRKAQEAGFSDSIRHDQYGIVLDARWIEERLHTPFRRPAG